MVAFSQMKTVTSIALLLTGGVTASNSSENASDSQNSEGSKRLIKDATKMQQIVTPIVGLAALTGGVGLGTHAVRDDRNDHEVVGDHLEATLETNGFNNIKVDTITISEAATENPALVAFTGDGDLATALGEHGARVIVNSGNERVQSIVDEVVAALNDPTESPISTFDLSGLVGDAASEVDTITIVRNAQSLSAGNLAGIFSLLTIGAVALALYFFLWRNPQQFGFKSTEFMLVGAVALGGAMTCGLGFHFAAMESIGASYGCFGAGICLLVLLAMAYNKLVLKGGVSLLSKPVGHVLGAVALIGSVALFYSGIQESAGDILAGGKGGMGEDAIFCWIPLTIGLVWFLWHFLKRSDGKNFVAELNRGQIAGAVASVGALTGMLAFGIECLCDQNAILGGTFVGIAIAALIAIPLAIRFFSKCVAKREA